VHHSFLGSGQCGSGACPRNYVGITAGWAHHMPSNDLPLGDVRQTRERNMNRTGQHWAKSSAPKVTNLLL